MLTKNTTHHTMIVYLTKELKLYKIIKRYSGNGKKVTDLVRTTISQNNNSMIVPPASNPRKSSNPVNPQATTPQKQKAPVAQEQVQMYQKAKADPNKVLQKMKQDEGHRDELHKQHDDAIRALIAQQERNKLKELEDKELKKTKEKLKDIDETKTRIIKTIPGIIGTILEKVANQAYVQEHEIKILLQYVKDNPSCGITLSENIQKQEIVDKQMEGLNNAEYTTFMRELCKNMTYIPKTFYEKYIAYIKPSTTIITSAEIMLHKDLEDIFKDKLKAFEENYHKREVSLPQ